MPEKMGSSHRAKCQEFGRPFNLLEKRTNVELCIPFLGGKMVFVTALKGGEKREYQGRRLMGHSLTGGHSFLLPGCGMMILSVFITVRVK